MSFSSVMDKLKHNDFTRMVSLKHEDSRGRALVFAHSALDSIASVLTTGIFYTSFLTMNGINIVDAGILNFVPYIASLVSLFSPSILERLPKRRWFLALSRGLYHLLFILGVTVMPNFVHGTQERLTCFVILVLAANIINALGGQGYTVWHSQFLPEPKLRSAYFTYNALIINGFMYSVGIISSIIADSLVGTPYADSVIILLRYIGYAFAVLDLIVLLLPKEYPYPAAAKRPRLTDVFVKPLKHRKFRNTMIVCFVYMFMCCLPSGVLNYHLLNSVNISYTFTNVVNVMYAVFLVLFQPYWRKKLNRHGWIKVYNMGNVLDIIPLVAYAFVNNGNYLWLLGSLRLFQHWLGVGRNIAYSNFIYLNLPEESQTNFFTFHSLITSFASFLGMSLGTWFVAVMGDASITLFGYTLTSVPVLLLINAAVSGIFAVFVKWFTPRFAPESEMAYNK